MVSLDVCKDRNKAPGFIGWVGSDFFETVIGNAEVYGDNILTFLCMLCFCFVLLSHLTVLIRPVLGRGQEHYPIFFFSNKSIQIHGPQLSI